jgi:2-polyprenyl-6-methoxyphenol hydroxylase-like FAD-dependent oxidoreductase
MLDDIAGTTESGRSDRHWGTAVVVGGGYAGLVAARVLADCFAEVIVVEQDEVNGDTGVHPHAPQGYHAHAVIAKGAQVLERLFPGLRAELKQAGAPVYDYGERMNFLLPTGYAPRVRTGVQIQSLTRDELERRLRRRVLALPEVTVRQRTRCVGLIAASPGRVTGVRLRPAGSAPGAEPLALTADLVVDASGRSSALAGWLDGLGVRIPAKRVVKAKITYTSVGFTRPDSGGPDFDAAYQMTFAPGVPRGGVLLAVEGGRWMCSLFGLDDQVPPTDDDGYLRFARSLANPRMAEQLQRRAGGEKVHRYTNLNNEWSQYHRVADWPQRLIALGDAVCVFNPVYGQGLTVAALEADLLRTMLEQLQRRGRELDGLSRRYQRRLAWLIRPPWTLSSTSDVMWHPGQHPFAVRAVHWYNQHLFAVAVEEPVVWAAFVRVANMMGTPLALLHPRIAARVLRQAVRSRIRARSRSAETEDSGP